jgi:hypothetical protein
LPVGRCAGDRSDNEAITPQEIARQPVNLVSLYSVLATKTTPELLDDFAGAEQGALSRAQGSIGLVDRHQKVVMLAIKVHLPKIGDPLAIALGAFGHHGKFGGNCGQIR